MAETPDFEQIARSIVDRVESHIREPFIPGEDDPVRETVIKQIAEQLRQVWNASGAADADLRRCGSCNKTLSECYDMPWYKGSLNCCQDCDHPSRKHLAMEQEQERLRRAAREKLTTDELSALGIADDGGR